jgi:DNA polymerase III subunit beta
MKLQVLQENLSKSLNIASRFSATKVQLPVLANLLFSVYKNKLTISATNLETSISLSIGAKVDEEGDITIPAKTVTELVSNLGTGTVNLETEKEHLKINTETFESMVLGMNSSDFPSVPHKIEKDTVNIPKEGLMTALGQVLYCVSSDESRPILTGVLLLVGDNSVSLVATDGFRLSRKNIPVSGLVDDFSVILPKNTLSELLRLVGESEKVEFIYKKKDSQVLFGMTDGVLASRVIEGNFPDYEKIIPKSSSIKISLDRNDLFRAVKLAGVFARESANVVKFNIKKGGLTVHAESQRSGNQKTQIDAKIEGEVDSKNGFTIAFNYKFLEDFLNSVKNDDLMIGLSDPNAPGVFTDIAEKDYLHIIMPVRLQE